jgi:subtilisin family serine protease
MRAATLLALVPMAAAAPSARSAPAPVIVPRGGNAIEGKYIVRMKSDLISTNAVSAAVSTLSTKADYTYKRGFKGFAGTLTPEELTKLQNNPDVAYIEQDARVTIMDTQEDAPWGLARISNEEPGSTTYTYDASAGEGTCAYVVDTGIDVEHPEFEGRAVWGENFSESPDGDGQGHGTHCAGTIGGKTYGVSKKTHLIAVKVLGDDGSGTNSGVISGMEWVVDDAPKRKECEKGAVVNMSLGGSTSEAVNAAAKSITDAGIFLAVAAGNEAQDAKNSSPASEPSACTVGASDSKDQIAEFSNFGALVDIFAPGVDVLSSVPGGKTEEMSGTSMASPHVAGIAAYYVGLGESIDGLCDFIAENGIDVVTGAPNGTTTTLINNGESA